MLRYFTQRMALFIPTMLLVSLLVFALMKIVPGDPALLILIGTEEGSGAYTQEELEEVRRQIGTDRPLVVRYSTWIWDLVRGDLGNSVWDKTPVVDELAKRLPVTLQLAVMAMFIAIVIAVPLGVLSAVRQDTWFDYAVKIYTVAGVAAPTFWIGIMGILIFSVQLELLPYGRRGDWTHYILPSVTLGWLAAAGMLRLVRSAMLDSMDSEYVRFARAKGVSGRSVIWKHAFRNALIAPITVIMLHINWLIGGLVVVEAVFGYPGLGQYIYDSALFGDFNAVEAAAMLLVTIAVGTRLLGDIAYTYLNPRIRFT